MSLSDARDLHPAIGGFDALGLLQLAWEPLRQAGLYGHVFTNVGSVALLTGSSQSLGSSLRSFTRRFRWTSVSPQST